MIRFLPLDRFLLARLVEHERDPLTAEMANGPRFEEIAMIAASYGNAFAVLDGADVVAGGGLVMHWAGRAEAWSLITNFARARHIVGATKFARSLMDRRQRDPAYRRIETYVRNSASFCGLAFAHAMGFELEGTMRAWDSAGRDYLLCARVARSSCEAVAREKLKGTS